MKTQALGTTSKGGVLELPEWAMLARSGDIYRLPLKDELCDFPANAEISFLPNRSPIVWDKKNKKPQILEKDPDSQEILCPTAAILPVGYLRTLLPASTPAAKDFLPQWAYTAVGLQEHQWKVAAIKIESSDRWENNYFNTPELSDRIKEKLLKYPQNRVLEQLSHCAADYHCSTAQNIFYERWEGALPVSPSCNAQCVGCISLQPEGLPPSSHERMTFLPKPDEILDTAISHLEESQDPILSFGQGCEGEPLLASPIIEKAILAIRSKTDRGTLNLNTNGSRPEAFEKLCRAGLEAVRISMNSTIKETYAAYYQPRGYTFKDVQQTARMARDHGLAVSINLLTFPGVTDREEEAEALIGFIQATQIDAIQWRNLAIDPDQYLLALPKRKGEILGVTHLLKHLRQEFPRLKHLSFSRPKEYFRP